ncbi:MAG: hypothetical protein IPK85_23790 [Gemmatimonadetes bacterium]|nr:hypothetical protein [Gemmatimonadota bacterium]
MSRIAAASLVFATLVACSTETRAPLEPSTDLAVSGGSSIAAATARVRCEVRTGRRSKISVDGNNLAIGGSYSARVRSGANTAASPAAAAVGDEAEFDFDSNPADIAQGATAIARTFITVQASGPDVMADILSASGVVVASGAADCRVR